MVADVPAAFVEPRWASVGSALIVASWLVASALYKHWLTEVIDLQTTTLRKLTGGSARGVLRWL